MNKNIFNLETPVYVIDEKKLINNLEILQSVRQSADCKILLAQKAFSAYKLYPIISKYLDGTTASGIFEAQLGYEYFGKENHVFSPAFDEKEFSELSEICSHISFNSFSQLEKYRPIWENKKLSVGIRINPEFSTQEGHEIYDPCGKFSRLGVTKSNYKPELMKNVDGLHFHTLCEQNSDDLIKTFEHFEKSFGKYLYDLKWINLGGGHHITREDYDIKALKDLIIYIKNKYNLTVYLEPGEAVALNAGYLVTSVMDTVQNGMEILILDTSAACHMPDVLEMPYRPPLLNSGLPGEKKYLYRLAGRTCLAGDVIGNYSFDEKVNIGDKLCFLDMAIYSMVKNNTFNGMPLPSIAILHTDGKCEVIKKFGYKDFKERLS